MIKYGELREVFKGAIEWVENNLNPHQQLIITLDGIKIVSDDYFEPIKSIKENNERNFIIPAKPHTFEREYECTWGMDENLNDIKE